MSPEDLHDHVVGMGLEVESFGQGDSVRAAELLLYSLEHPGPNDERLSLHRAKRDPDVSPDADAASQTQLRLRELTSLAHRRACQGEGEIWTPLEQPHLQALVLLAGRAKVCDPLIRPAARASDNAPNPARNCVEQASRQPRLEVGNCGFGPTWY